MSYLLFKTAHKKRLFKLGAHGMKISQTETSCGDEGEAER